MTRPATTRVDLTELTPIPYAALGRLAGTVEQEARAAGLEAAVLELVRIRASQINGCTFCLDMHTGAALANGETRPRLDAVSNWADSALFSAREQAALALTEAVTRLPDAGVPDEVHQRAAAQFDDAQLTLLLWTATVINAFNRLAVGTGLRGQGR